MESAPPMGGGAKESRVLRSLATSALAAIRSPRLGRAGAARCHGGTAALAIAAASCRLPGGGGGGEGGKEEVEEEGGGMKAVGRAGGGG